MPRSPCPPGQTRNLKTKECRDKLKKGRTMKAAAAPAKAASPALKVLVTANSIQYTMANVKHYGKDEKYMINNIGAFNKGYIVGFINRGQYYSAPQATGRMLEYSRYAGHDQEYEGVPSSDNTFTKVLADAALGGLWVVFQASPGLIGHTMAEILEEDMWRAETWDAYQSNGKFVSLVRSFDSD